MWTSVKGSGKYFVPGKNMDSFLTFTSLAAAGPPPVLVKRAAPLPAPPPPERQLELETPAMAAPGQQLLVAPQPATRMEHTFTTVPTPELHLPCPADSCFLFILCISILLKLVSFKVEDFIHFKKIQFIGIKYILKTLH